MVNVTLIVLGVPIVICVLFFFLTRRHYWRNIGVPYIDILLPVKMFLAKLGQLNGISTLTSFYNILKSQDPNATFGGFFVLFTPFAVALNLDFIRDILGKDFPYFHDRGMYYNEKDDPLSAHMVNIEGAKWRNLRGKLSPTFSAAKIRGMFPIVIGVAQKMEQYLQEVVAKDQVIEMRDIVARYTTDVIGNCSLGLECNSLEDPDVKFRKMGKKFLSDTKNSIIRRLFLLMFRNYARKMHFKIVEPDVESFFVGVVKETIDYREKNNVHRKDFMDLMIALKNTGSVDPNSIDTSINADDKLTINEIAAQALIFFMAGYETSSISVSYTLYELSINPDIQEKARECVRSALARHNGELSYESISEMGYIEQCINESLRKYPPIANILRSASKDYQVPNTEIVIKEGVKVFIPIYAIHHDANNFPNPEKYDPDRFSAEEKAKRHPYAFMPFGGGPRICLGMRFGMMQTRVAIATLLNSFRFSACPKSVIPMKFSSNVLLLSPADGLFMNVEKL